MIVEPFANPISCCSSMRATPIFTSLYAGQPASAAGAAHVWAPVVGIGDSVEIAIGAAERRGRAGHARAGVVDVGHSVLIVVVSGQPSSS